MTRRELLLASLTLPFTFLGCTAKHQADEQPQNADLFIESDGDFLAYKPDTLTIRTGTMVRLTFHHAGQYLSARHNWVLVYPNQMEAVDKDVEKKEGIVTTDDPRVIAVVPMCDKGQTMTTYFTAPAPGEYPFFCSTPGHAVDMNGILRVTA